MSERVDAHIPRSILRTPPSTPSRRLLGNLPSPTPVFSGTHRDHPLPFHATPLKRVNIIRRHTESAFTYTADQYDRSSIECEREEAVKLEMKRTVSIQERDDEEELMVGYHFAQSLVCH